MLRQQRGAERAITHQEALTAAMRLCRDFHGRPAATIAPPVSGQRVQGFVRTMWSRGHSAFAGARLAAQVFVTALMLLGLILGFIEVARHHLW